MERIHTENLNTAERFDEVIWNPKLNERPYFDATRHRELARGARAGDTVLDVGAGVFGTCQYLATEGAEAAPPGLHLVAIDFSEVAMRVTREYAPKVQYYVANILPRMPFDDDRFDLVVSGEVIEHMEDPGAFAADLCRVSRREVCISTVDPHCEDAQGMVYPEHLWDFTPEDLLGFFEPFGDTEYYVFGDYHMVRCLV